MMYIRIHESPQGNLRWIKTAARLRREVTGNAQVVQRPIIPNRVMIKLTRKQANPKKAIITTGLMFVFSSLRAVSKAAGHIDMIKEALNASAKHI